MPKGIKIVGWFMVAGLSLISLISGLDREEISYFIAFGIPVILIGGWIIALIATQSPNQKRQDRHEKIEKVALSPGHTLARGIGIAMIVIGVLSFFSIAGIFSIFIGIGLIRFKRQSYVNAKILIWIQIVASALVFIVGIILSGTYSAMNMQSGLNIFLPWIIIGILGLILNFTLLSLLERPSVREVYWQSPA